MSFTEEIEKRAICIFEDLDESKLSIDEKVKIFLAETHDLRISESKKLRQFAIIIEENCFANRWEEMQSIYERAIASDPIHLDIYHSIAVSAIEWVTGHTLDPLTAKSILDYAESSIVKAISISEEQSSLYYTFGQVIYSRETNDKTHRELTERALSLFLHAYELDHENLMANLYVAFCLEDLKDWESACDRYEQIDIKAFEKYKPQWVWRAHVAKVNRAKCCFKAGRKQESTQIVKDYLDIITHLNSEEAMDYVEPIDNLFDFLKNQLNNESLLLRLQDLYIKFGINIPEDWTVDEG
jgi:flagellin-specific chaperone FliS